MNLDDIIARCQQDADAYRKVTEPRTVVDIVGVYDEPTKIDDLLPVPVKDGKLVINYPNRTTLEFDLPTPVKRKTVTDGRDVWTWDELTALFRSWGFPSQVKMYSDLVGLEITLTVDHTTFVVARPGKTYVQKIPFQVDKTGFEVYRSPEFRALCRRLGVPHDLPTVDIHLRFYAGEYPVVTHQYQCEEPAS